MRLKYLYPIIGLILAACAMPEPTRAPMASPALLPLPTDTVQPAVPPATVTPRATPVIIASPTASATPVTHVVVDGESLLSIAIDYGVSLEALQAANPDVQVRFLSVGAVLTIPPPEGGAAVS